MEHLEKLYAGYYYHIYNRGNNKENIFIEKSNYDYFFKLYDKYIRPIADTFVYCLLRNHFHFLIRIKANQDTCEVSKTSQVFEEFDYSQPFANFFNAYAKAFNKKYKRTGSLFQKRFGRKRIASDAYLIHLVHYIHFNSQRHKFVTNFREYSHSSYVSILSNKKTHLMRTDVLEWFGGRTAFQEFHYNYDFKNHNKIQYLIEEDEF